MFRASKRALLLHYSLKCRNVELLTCIISGTQRDANLVCSTFVLEQIQLEFVEYEAVLLLDGSTGWSPRGCR